MTAMGVPRRPILAGNGLGGAYVLDLLIEAFPLDDILVIAPSETERHDWQPSLADHARECSVPVLRPDRVNDSDVLERVSEHHPDLLLSVYYTQIFRPELLQVVNGPALNFHPSLLPRHRGTAPLIWSIVEGDEMAGVSVHELTPGIDTGDLVYQRKLGIHPDDTGYSLHLKAANLVRSAAAGLLRDLLRGEGLPSAVEQHGAATYHSKKDPRVNHLDFTQPRDRIRNIVRALAPPLPGAYAMIADRRVVFERVEAVAATSHPRLAATLQIERTTGRVFAWAADGPLELCEVVVDGERLTGAELPGRLELTDGAGLR